ncbi:MAG: hypothetical protein KA085_18180 [Phenylobacterium sp.]|uniref:DUF6527 family protein n=1 Tax=Phenylobacterium sp. TaxID=1871053 RepID=UPI001B6FB99A|nr:DUF6527 family protein [Phenylobacterium sp.]MBP7648472.1 hypothetical protein [Phenylobacterium sp.]MBP7818050.1 hypothetical protein [Phenylobacterium sp.]MBP9753798.1 hypothetical protein [Phenylobacterium sp.]
MSGRVSNLARQVGAWVAGADAELRAWHPPWADPRIKVILTDREPARPKAGRIYVATASGRPTFGYLVCPCGCRETLHLRFLPNRFPRWDIAIEGNGVVSLMPSVWRQVGCRSHFILKRGKIHWC